MREEGGRGVGGGSEREGECGRGRKKETRKDKKKQSGAGSVQINVDNRQENSISQSSVSTFATNLYIDLFISLPFSPIL